MISLKGVKAVVTDIEGTTSSISFVHDVMFPYARERMEAFIRANEADIAEHLDDVRAEEGDKRMPLDEVIETLIRWIDEDRKATPLKAIQGMIWKEGFETEAFKGHIYDDAVAGLTRWHEAGKALYVYSSGSIAAQKLLYGHSEAGDITPLFSGYFDTTTGGKRETLSYEKIAQALKLPAGEIVFLSDVVAELEAADEAGFQTVLLDRKHELDEGIWGNKTDTFANIQIA